MSSCNNPGRAVKLPVFFAALFCSCLSVFSRPAREEEKRVTLELEGNPTTGYSWTYVLEGEGALRELSAEYRRAEDSGGRVGGGGIFIFVFESVRPGRVELVFSYRRPWETDIEAAETRNFVFTVSRSGRIRRRPSG
jgi:predicted secreted protein